MQETALVVFEPTLVISPGRLFSCSITLERVSGLINSIPLHDVDQTPGSRSIAFKRDLLAFVDLKFACDD